MPTDYDERPIKSIIFAKVMSQRAVVLIGVGFINCQVTLRGKRLQRLNWSPAVL